ncbi:MAG TPA: hypothetical protein VKR06_41010 [Ktedonosporobacter sp.]|nr:hypothetical protein [Ktedonosporobacter sp.]
MRSLSNIVIGTVVGIGVIITFFVLFHLLGITWQFSQLVSALIGGSLTLFSVVVSFRKNEEVEPWLGRERLAWGFIGCGLIMWGIGESFWRYDMLTHQSPFPSLADIGYVSLPPLIFIGLLLQPSSGVGRRRWLMLLDSLIAMSSMMTIGWYLLLGALAQTSNENALAKFLGLYYPTTDIALLSCVILLLLRGQGSLYQATARRVSLLVVGIGFCFFASSDFIFNVQQNAGSYIDGTWTDLGWSWGMLAIGLAGYLRRFLPLTSEDMIEQRLRRRSVRISFGFAQLTTYIMVAILFVVLVLNVFSADRAQVAIRPVLLLATIAVVGLVVIRHILTLWDNDHLARRQANALERLEAANQRIEEQARMTAERNAELEQGILHLKDVQARLANGNLRARARLNGGELLPLAASLNLMAERLAHLEQVDGYSQRLIRAIQELGTALEHYRSGEPLRVPPGCRAFPEINRLLLVLGFKDRVDMPNPLPSSGGGKPTVPPTLSPGLRARLGTAAMQHGFGQPSQPLPQMSSLPNEGLITPIAGSAGFSLDEVSGKPANNEIG